MKDSFIARHLFSFMLGFIILGALATIVASYFYIEMFGTALSEKHAVWAQFGEYMGGVLGPAFAFLALMALLITLQLQYKELSISSSELHNSASALSQQSESLELQNFENRFFNMLNLHHTIVNGIDLRGKDGAIIQGRDCLRVFYNRLNRELGFVKRLNNPSYGEGILQRYEQFYRENGHELSHYFRHLYRIFKYIENSDIDDKRDYSGILRAQLSNHELGLLYYNGLSHHGEKLKPLAEKYALFENMEIELLNDARRDVHLYGRESFGDRAESPFKLDT